MDDALPPVVEVRHDLRVELPITAALAGVVVGFRLLRDDLEPSHCRLCDGAPGHVNAVDGWFRDSFRHRNSGPANITSYALAFGAAPLAAAGLTLFAASKDQRTNEVVVDIVAIAEGGLTAMLVTEVVESTVLRQRPYVHAIADAKQRDAVVAETGAFHSFPAGHVVEAFGLATAAGVVASTRGYRYAPLVWAGGMAIGFATMYTRIAADRHYFSDAVAGAAIGSLTGGMVPLLFHQRRVAFSATPIAHGQMVNVGWSF